VRRDICRVEKPLITDLKPARKNSPMVKLKSAPIPRHACLPCGAIVGGALVAMATAACVTLGYLYVVLAF